MNSLATYRPTLRVNSDPSRHGPGSVSACLGPDLVAFLASYPQPGDLLKSIFRVTVAQARSPDGDSLPDVSGRYLLFQDEVQFIPHFPLEKDVKYCASFDPRPLGAPLTAEPLMLEFLIPTKQSSPAPTEITHIFPSSNLLPENLLRFYVYFSNSMQRGRALKEISLLDSDRQPVADALYRPPVELWDRTMRHLTVLLDPGRLKRWVGPNVELGPPLKMGQQYTLEIGSGMIDLYGRPLRERFRKHFLVGKAVREPISVEHWTILLPVTGSRQALVLMFTNPLDRALLLQTITIGSADGSVIGGQVVVDQCERRWSFTPSSPWLEGEYHIRVECSLEDVCGNSITGAFDRPLRKGANLVADRNGSSLTFQLISGPVANLRVAPVSPAESSRAARKIPLPNENLGNQKVRA
jgi:hypothetical protein